MRPTKSSHAPGQASVKLTWPGKADAPAPPPGDDAPVLRVMERYGPGDEQTGDDVARAGSWRNALVRGDNLALLRALLTETWRARIAAAGGLRLVYLDPPFLTGQDLHAEIRIGDTKRAGGRERTVRLPAYRDAGPRELPAYLSEMRERLVLIRDLLADDGSLYLHCDHRLNAYLRLLLDEVFGPDRFVNEIVWHYGLGNPGGARAFARKHDTILLYAKTDRYRFHRLRGEVTPAMANKYRHHDEHGRYMLAYGRRYRLKGGKPFDSVWEIPSLAATDRERLGYPTQKPEALLERIIAASSDPGDLVADLCAGCGTFAAVATRLGRRWLVCDRSRLAIHLSRTRSLRLGDRLRAAGWAVPGFDVIALDGPVDREPAMVGGHRFRLAVEAVRASEGMTFVLRDLRVEPDDDPEAIAAALRPGRTSLVVADGRLVRLSRHRSGQLDRLALTEEWSDWLETWAVQVGSGDSASVFQPDWLTYRQTRGRGLPLVSPPLDGRPGKGGPARVLATTPFGAEISLTLPTGEAAESSWLNVAEH